MPIPKLIHYCWISGDPFPEKVTRCLESWKTFMPDYRLELWDKKKCLGLGIPFVNDAIDAKNYAFAADVVRVAALLYHGGIYLDTDVLLYKNLDPLLKGSYISFLEVWTSVFNRKITKDKKGRIIRVKGIGLQAAVMASEKNHPFLSILYSFYSKLSYSEDTMNYLLNNLAPTIQAEMLLDFGFVFSDRIQNLRNNIIIYPSSFITNGFNHTQDAFGSHLCLGGWKSEKNRKKEYKQYIFKRLTYLLLKKIGIIKLYRILFHKVPPL